MGFFDRIFANWPRPRRYQGRFETLTAYEPYWRRWDGRLYESQLFRAAVDAKARHISKLQVEPAGSARPALQAKLRAGPNTYQTWSQFLYRVATILEVENTAFITPVLDDYGELTGYVPVCPRNWELVQYDGEPWIRFDFYDDRKAAIELHRVGILTKYQYRSDFFGESNAALTPTMELIDLQNQGIAEGVKSAATYRFMAKLNNFSAPEKLKKEREEFNERNLRGGSGVLLFPNTWTDIRQIESKPFVVDADQISIIENDIYNYVGVNEAVLQSKATAEKLDAFYNGVIEPFAIQLADVLTKMTFTPRERGFKNEIRITSNRLQYMNISSKIKLITMLWDRGAATINEGREILDLAPLEGEAGEKIPVRGEYYDASEVTIDAEAGEIDVATALNE